MKDNVSDIIEITSLPQENPIIGNEFDEEVGIGTVKPGYAFQVLLVEGHVKWKEHGPGDPDADLTVLTLKRISHVRKEQCLGEIQLGQFELSKRSKDEYTELKFHISPDPKNPFWEQGTKCEIVSCQKGIML